ncbi:phosphotransferase [Nonomuraea lactucae]|uniref:phosphotransferase n=1 Tax=Nonomuraea lactucae TaxID=2249762 RepID=UPI0013B4052F|nr:phosphotransferase [Nonomuraea lactucae]
MTVDVALVSVVARLFGLGEVRSAPVRLQGYGTAGAWRVRTDTGRWVVKTARPVEPWEFAAMRDAGALERAAIAAGVTVPRAVEPPHDAGAAGRTAGYWTAVPGRPDHARVSEWMDGEHPLIPADAGVAAWLGRTVAVLAAAAPPASVHSGRGYPLHPLAAWQEWLDAALKAELVDQEARERLWSAVVEGTRIVEAGLAAPPPLVISHRDINHRNILLTARGPALIDFDVSGPEAPWWELVHFAFLLACASLGDDEPDPALLAAAVRAFEEAGGQAGGRDVGAFTGLVRGMLEWPAQHLSLVLSAGRLSPARRAAAVAQIHDAARVLPEIVRSLDRWAGVLRSL